MQKFSKVRSVVVYLDKVNVDTDQIIPKQFLKLVTKSGFGRYLFYNWRFKLVGAGNNTGTTGVDTTIMDTIPTASSMSEDVTPNPEFVLNDPVYSGARVLITEDNFGCGSSREHAVWALQDFGFQVIIAPSFADIFYNNCFKNGVLAIVLPRAVTQKIVGVVTVDLETQSIVVHNNANGDYTIPFDIDPYKKKVLLEGLDDIAITLGHVHQIQKYEQTAGAIIPISSRCDKP